MTETGEQKAKEVLAVSTVSLDITSFDNTLSK